jgi:hypothetical protein
VSAAGQRSDPGPAGPVNPGAVRRRRHWLADWRSVRGWEGTTRERLRRRHALWLHGWCIGLVVLLVMWGMAHLQMVLGSESLALRYLVTLGAGYLVFLLVLRAWAGWLVGEQGSSDLPDPGDALEVLPDVAEALARGAVQGARGAQPLRSGGGGDFGGGGAQGDFVPDADAGAIGESGSAVGELASGAVEAAAASDEGAVVVVPVVAVFLVGLAVVFGVGSLLLLYFGSEVLLAVALELAFGYVSARTAVRVAREGWLGAAVRLTWKPLAGALACAVVLGLVIDLAVPQARSLPHAVQLLRTR